MLYYDYSRISDAIKGLNDLVNDCFVYNCSPRPVQKDEVNGSKKEAVECFTDDQKSYLDGLVQRCVNDSLGSICKDIHQLYVRSGALSSSVEKLKEDKLRLEGIILELSNRIKTLEDHTKAHAEIIVDNSENIGVLIENNREIVRRNVELREEVDRVDNQFCLITKSPKNLETLLKDTDTKR